MSADEHPYASLSYLSSLGVEILDVPEWGTPVMLRPIPGTNWIDAAGGYPLAVLRRGADLAGGLCRLRRSGAVSVVLVLDGPIGPDEASINTTFPIFRRFKTHYLYDRSRGDPIMKDNHRRNIRKARARCNIATIDLSAALEEWGDVYRELVKRHAISGIADFSPSYFAALARRPDVNTCAAFRDGRMIAAALWLRYGRTMYYHLGASRPEGYQNSAMFGLFDFAFRYHTDCDLFDLGGNAGSRDSPDDRLAVFKRGFANASRPTNIYGAILDEMRYATLTADRPLTSFFPAYRATASER